MTAYGCTATATAPATATVARLATATADGDGDGARCYGSGYGDGDGDGSLRTSGNDPLMAKIYSRVLREVTTELDRAIRKCPKLNSAHEGFAVILEELDELKTEVWRKQSKRRPKKMRQEAVQIAAMAMRFALEACGGE